MEIMTTNKYFLKNKYAFLVFWMAFEVILIKFISMQPGTMVDYIGGVVCMFLLAALFAYVLIQEYSSFQYMRFCKKYGLCVNALKITFSDGSVSEMNDSNLIADTIIFNTKQGLTVENVEVIE